MGNSSAYEAAIRGDHCSVIEHSPPLNDPENPNNPCSFENVFNQAQSYQKTGRLDQAVVSYTKIIRSTPDVESLFSRGLCHLKLSHLQLAISDFSDCIRLKTDKKCPIRLADCYHNLSLCYSQMDQLEVSESHISEAIRLDPRNSVFFVCRARLFYKKMEYQNALNDFNIAISLSPAPKVVISNRQEHRHRRNNERQIYERGKCYFCLGKYNDALHDFLTFLKLRPDDYEVNVSIGKCFHILKDYDQSLKYYRQIAEELEQKEMSTRTSFSENGSPEKIIQLPKLYMLMGSVFFDDGQYKIAIQYFTKTVVVALRSKIGSKRRVDSKRHSSSLDVVDQYIQQAVMSRGSSHYILEQYEKSIEDCTYIIKNFGNGNEKNISEILIQRGMSFEKLGRFGLAVQDFESSIQMNPNSFQSHYILGTLCLEKLQEYRKSVKSFTKCVELKEDHGMVWCKLGIAYQHLNEIQSALNCFSRSIRVFSNHHATQKDIFHPLYSRSKLYFEKMDKDFHYLGVSDYLKLREILLDTLKRKNKDIFLLREKKTSVEELKIMDLDKHIDQFLKDRYIDTNELIRTATDFYSIGQGSSATVFRVELESETNEVLAVKQFEREKNEYFRTSNYSGKKRSCAEEEALILFSKRHPNIIKCLGCSKDAIVTEYGKNESIRKHIMKKKAFRKDGENYLTLEKKLKIFRGVSNAMMYLHETCGICHRDLKLENVVIMDDSFHVKLIDFGLAKNKCENLTTFCGTDFYVAPEVLVRGYDRQGYSKKCDIFSFGVMVFILMFEIEDVVGKLKECFYGSRLELESFDWSVRFPKKKFSEKEEKIVEIMKCCLSKTPEERIEFSQIVKRLEVV